MRAVGSVAANVRVSGITRASSVLAAASAAWAESVVTLTPMAVKAWSDPAKSGPMLGRIPLGRFAQPEEVAEVILYLLGDASAMMNGAIVPVDGGFLAT